MAAPRSGQRSRFTVMVLVMICLTLITIDTKANGGGVLHTVRAKARDALAPAQGGLDRIAGPVADFADGLVNSGDLKDENRRLREENDRLQGQVAAAADAQRQLTILQDKLNLDVAKDIPKVTARVINTAPSNVQLTVEIDRGTDAGIDVGMPVVVGDGLVGRIASATGSRAVVVLITDPGVNVTVRFAATGLLCSVRGDGAGKDLSAELVKPDATVNQGDVLVTSGLEGGRFPEGIPVGRVDKAVVVAGVAYQDVRVAPLVDFNRLEYVQVLLSKAKR